MRICICIAYFGLQSFICQPIRLTILNIKIVLRVLNIYLYVTGKINNVFTPKNLDSEYQKIQNYVN